jgi:hypothetical protein
MTASITPTEGPEDSASELLQQGAGLKPEKPGRRALHEVVHAWIPLMIAVVSVLAALMGWRASLADETSAHSDELARQDLVHQQQLVIQDNGAIDTDIRTFGQFAQYSALAHSLLQDAGKISGPVSDQLLAEGQADLGLARQMGTQIVFQNYAFDPSNPSANPALRIDGTYLPGHPYGAALALGRAENADTALHGLAPEALHATAEAAHTRGVNLTGIAALFVAVMVLLTFAAIVKGPPKVVLAGSGGALAVVALILFSVVQSS